MTDEEIFMENFNALLEARGMNASSLAKLMDSSYVTVGSYTRGKLPDTRRLLKISRLLGVPMDDLFKEHRFGVERAVDELEDASRDAPELRTLPHTLRLLSIRVGEGMDALEQLFYGVLCKDEDRRAAKSDYLRHCRTSAQKIQDDIEELAVNVGLFLR